MNVYVRAKFQVSSVTLTSFRQGVTFTPPTPLPPQNEPLKSQLRLGLTNIINKDLDNNKFPENAKTALCKSLTQKDDRGKIQNYRPTNILNGFSKIFERYLRNSLPGYFVIYYVL